METTWISSVRPSRVIRRTRSIRTVGSGPGSPSQRARLTNRAPCGPSGAWLIGLRLPAVDEQLGPGQHPGVGVEDALDAGAGRICPAASLSALVGARTDADQVVQQGLEVAFGHGGLLTDGAGTNVLTDRSGRCKVRNIPET